MESGTWSSSSRAPGDEGTVDDFAPAPAPDAFAAFLDRYTDFGPAPLVPEVRVFQARGVLEVWEAAERLAGRPMPAPFWAFAWAGGLALARVLLDSPARVRGRRVLDIGTGGGVVALAAALAGAREVVANDRDPWALATACLAAERQSLALTPLLADLTAAPFSPGSDPPDDDPEGRDAEGEGSGVSVFDGFDIVVCGDLGYERRGAPRVRSLLDRARSTGLDVLVADAGRAYFDTTGLRLVASYTIPAPPDLEGVSEKVGTVYEPA